MSKNLFIFDKMAVKWVNNNKKYCVVFHRDDVQRDFEDFEFLNQMYFFHRRYAYGISHKFENSHDMWLEFVGANVPWDEIIDYAISDKISGFHVTKNGDDSFDVSWDEYSDCNSTDCSKESTVQYIKEELSSYDCQTLLRPYAEWKYVYGYDHSGLSVSLADSYPYNDRWDGGTLGISIIFKKDYCDGEYITEDNWRDQASKVIENEFETYKSYIEGDVFGYDMFVFNNASDGDEDDFDNWDEVDPSVWGFYGDDAMTNGMSYDIGNGFEEAVASDRYEEIRIQYRSIPYFA